MLNIVFNDMFSYFLFVEIGKLIRIIHTCVAHVLVVYINFL